MNLFNRPEIVNNLDVCGRILKTVQDIPDIAREKAEIKRSVDNVRTAANTTFLHVRSYVKKSYSLAEFIIDTKDTVIAEIEAKKAEGLEDFLTQILDISESCQKDINNLLKDINEKKQITDEEERKVEEKHKEASDKANRGKLVGAMGGVAAVGGVVAAIAVGGVFVGGGGLFVAIMGVIVAIKGSEYYEANRELQEYCQKALDSIRETRTCLEEFEKGLKHVTHLLKVGIDNKKIKEHKDDRNTFKKISDGNEIFIRKMKGNIILIADQAQDLKTPMEKLKDTDSVEGFAEKCAEITKLPLKKQNTY